MVEFGSTWRMARANAWITVVKTCEKQCRDGEDSRKMKLVTTSKETARLAGSKGCDRQPSFVNAGNTHAGVSASNCVCYLGTFMCWRDTRVMENESRKISRHTLELRDDEKTRETNRDVITVMVSDKTFRHN